MGIGVFCVLVSGFFIAQVIGGKFGIVRNFWSDLDGTLTWVAFSFLAGVHAFGWLMIWRSSLDERARQGELDQAADAISDRDEYIDKLEAEVDKLRLAYANLEDDLAETRRSLHMAMGQASQRYRQPDEEVEPIAERNAKFLLNLAYRGDKWGRDHIVRTYDNWTPTMWTEARNLLELAGIVRTVGKATELLKPDYSTAVVALGAYCHNDQ